MTLEQFISIMLAFAAVLGGIAKCIAELRAYHSAVNSKMDRLLALTASSSKAEGRLEGPAGGTTPYGSKYGPNDPPSAHIDKGHN